MEICKGIQCYCADDSTISVEESHISWSGSFPQDTSKIQTNSFTEVCDLVVKNETHKCHGNGDENEIGIFIFRVLRKNVTMTDALYLECIYQCVKSGPFHGSSAFRIFNAEVGCSGEFGKWILIFRKICHCILRFTTCFVPLWECTNAHDNPNTNPNPQVYTRTVNS